MWGNRIHLAACLLLVALLGACAGRTLSQGGNGNGQGRPLPPLEDGPSDPVEDADSPIRPVNDPFDTKLNLVEDELIVKFKPGVTKENRGKALGKGNGAEKQKLREDASGGDVTLVTVKLAPGQAKRAQLRAAAARIQMDEDVEYAEPNFLYTKSQTNDPNVGQLWGMQAAGAGANAVGAWAKGYTSCSDVVIGVIDTGIQYDHPDLAAHMWVNPVEIAGNGVDDDGNGKVDDVYGWDFYTNDASTYDDTNDNHGTHVSGTIGAVGNNGQGVVGVCQSGVKIISTKFLGGSTGSGSTAGAVNALYYLLDLKTRHNLNLVATSNSWGGGGYSTTLYNAIIAHRNAGILFVAAAGNSAYNMDVTIDYPAGYDLANIISVGSITSSGSISSFSNYGATTVDLFAPGSSILSTWSGYSYTTISGTSMATPHVTGAVALYAAAYKRSTGVKPTADAIKAAVMSTGTASTTYSGYCVSGKRLNIGSLLNTVPTAPPPSPSPAPSQPSPSPSPPPPSPSPTPDQPSPSPEPPSPSPSPPTPPSPSPSPPMKKKMFVKLSVSQLPGKKSGWFYCKTLISAIDAITGAQVTGSMSVVGAYSITPDVNGWSDYSSTFPTTMSGTFTTSASANSYDIPKYSKVTSWKNWRTAMPAGYTGTSCEFRVQSLTHPDYELDLTSPTYPGWVVSAKA